MIINDYTEKVTVNWFYTIEQILERLKHTQGIHTHAVVEEISLQICLQLSKCITKDNGIDHFEQHWYSITDKNVI